MPQCLLTCLLNPPHHFAITDALLLPTACRTKRPSLLPVSAPQPPTHPPTSPSACRYFILKGSTLTYFRGERDTQFPPRGQIDLTGTCLILEGLKRRRHWTWQIVDKQVGGCRGARLPVCVDGSLASVEWQRA
jgi:hypothetical protein